jgi:hypothetical protein
MRRSSRLVSSHGHRSSARSKLPVVLDLEFLEGRCLLSSALSGYGQLPVSFQPNQGQANARFDFIAQGAGSSVLLSSNSVALGLQRTGSAAAPDVLNMQLLEASAVAGVGLDPQAGVANYVIGNDPSQWHTGIPNDGAVQYTNVYPGISVVYHGNQQQLEYDFVVAPGANPGLIQLSFEGQKTLAIDGQGNLVIHAANGDVIEQAPVVYQTINGVRHTIAGRYVLENAGRVGFAVAGYDASQPLTIDPVLSYSTYLGGSGTDGGFGIAVDASGEAYIVGRTLSANFPLLNAAQPSSNGNKEAFIAKLNASGTALLFSTYLGGSANNEALNVAVDSAGNAYVTGDTQSSDFPTLNAFQSHYGGGRQNAFVAKISNSGTLLYSTYLGGSSFDEGLAIAVDQSGNAYVTGDTQSTDFPTANALQPTFGGGSPPNAGDAFLTKLNAAGNGLVYSTFVGGSANDIGEDVVVDSAGDAFVAGGTTSTDFPTLNAIQKTNAGGLFDAFVAEINPAGSGFVYSTYLGGSGEDVAYGIGIDASGNTYVDGYTGSSDFPTANALQPTNRGGTDAFAAKLSTGGTSLLYATYLGGSSTDFASGIAVDAAGDAYVTGSTGSADFPTVNPAQSSIGGAVDAFVSKINPQGTALAYSTYLGGIANDFGNRIAVDTAGNAYVVGETGSVDFPVTQPVQGSDRGGDDAFVTKIGNQNGPPINPGSVLSAVNSGGTSVLFALTPTNLLYRYQAAVGWQLLGAGVRSISAVTETSGNVVLFAVTLDSGMYRFDSIYGWLQIGGVGSVRTVSAGTDSNGRAAAFVMLTDGSLTEYRTSSGWLGGSLGAAGTILSIAATQNDTVIAITSDHSLYEYNRQYGWFPLTSSGFAQSVQAVTDGSGQLAVYAQTLNQALYRYSPATGWGLLGAPGTIQAISAGTDASGQSNVFVRTSDNDLLENDSVKGWSLLSAPKGVYEFSAAGSDRVFGSLADGSVYAHDDAFGFYPLTSPGFAHA